MSTLRSVVHISVFAGLAGLGLCRVADDNALKLWRRQPAGRQSTAGPTTPLNAKAGRVYTIEFERPAAQRRSGGNRV